MKPIIIYYRVSTDRKGKSGLGLAAQRVACEPFAHNHGYEISAEFREVETGKGADALDRRPQLAAALAMAKKLKCPVPWTEDKLAGSCAKAMPRGSVSEEE